MYQNDMVLPGVLVLHVYSVFYRALENLISINILKSSSLFYFIRDVTPYPEYLKQLMRSNLFELNDKRDHTRSYLISYNEGNARPPIQYYRKVGAKDKVGDILSTDDLEGFYKIIQ